MTDKGESKPTPDPTSLTTAQMLREVENAVKLIEAELKVLDQKVEGYRLQYEARWEANKENFSAAESNRLEQKTDTQRAVKDAFDAAEKTTSKSEATMTEQVKSLRSEMQATFKGLETQVAANAASVIRIDAMTQGKNESHDTQRADVALLATLAFLALAIIGAAISIAAAVAR